MELYRAKSDRRCLKGHTIKAGETYYSYRERALSSHEAAHEGMYPKRRLCMCCGEARKAKLEAAK